MTTNPSTAPLARPDTRWRKPKIGGPDELARTAETVTTLLGLRLTHHVPNTGVRLGPTEVVKVHRFAWMDSDDIDSFHRQLHHAGLPAPAIAVRGRHNGYLWTLTTRFDGQEGDQAAPLRERLEQLTAALARLHRVPAATPRLDDPLILGSVFGHLAAVGRWIYQRFAHDAADAVTGAPACAIHGDVSPWHNALYRDDGTVALIDPLPINGAPAEWDVVTLAGFYARRGHDPDLVLAAYPATLNSDLIAALWTPIMLRHWVCAATRPELREQADRAARHLPDGLRAQLPDCPATTTPPRHPPAPEGTMDTTTGTEARHWRGHPYNSAVTARLADQPWPVDRRTRAAAFTVGAAAARLPAGMRALHTLAEGAASSRLEGYVLPLADVANAVATERRTGLDGLIAANVHAVHHATSTPNLHRTTTPQWLCELHEQTLAGTSADRIAGVLRTQQNWIGTPGSTPVTAEFVPPAPELVADALDDLAQLCDRDDIPAAVRAWLCHAQYETIHPHDDGNGRAGRVLWSWLLAREHGSGAVPPLSAAIFSTPHGMFDYVNALTAFRNGDPVSGLMWFADTAQRAADNSRAAAQRIDSWRDDALAAARPRRGSTVEKLLRLPAALAVTDAETAAATIKASVASTRSALNDLTRRDLLTRTSGPRGKARYTAPEIIALAAAALLGD